MADPATSLWWQTADPIPTDSEPPASCGVLVAGAGLSGIATALLLARRGLDVTVVEARRVGAVTTGNTTGKLSLLQGSTLGAIREEAGDQALRAYVVANQQAQEWVLHEADADETIAERQRAVTFATTPDGDRLIAREREALDAAGLPFADTAPTELPFPVTTAIAMDGQWQLHPIRLLALLVERLRAAGGRVIEGCRVLGAEVADDGARVETERGDIACGHLVLATGTPILDRGLHFAKLVPSRAFVGAYAVDDDRVPSGIHLSVDARSRSLRTARDAAGRPLLLVGSEGFTPGREESPQEVLDGIDEWTAQRFPGARRTTWWAAQDYVPAGRLPYAGPMPRGAGRVHVMTGYSKWGMTNAVAAALAVAGGIVDDKPEWATELFEDRPLLAATGDTLMANAEVAGHLAGGWLSAETTSEPDDPPAEGTGRVARRGLRPVAESTVDGEACALSAVCTHLGGIVQWNDAERTWDCPLHGSRFDHRGRLLEGPAVRDLHTV